MGVLITDGFGEGDDEQATSILKKWNGGILSDQLVTNISKMAVQASVITVIFRTKNENTEVLLLPRPSDDPVWPNMLNLPGKMLRVADFKRPDNEPLNGPFERIQENELKTKFSVSPRFAGVVFQNTKRGPMVALVYTALVSENVSVNDWVWGDTAKLKDLDNFLDTETSAIEMALKSYLAGSNHLPSL